MGLSMKLRTQPKSETLKWGNNYVTGEKHGMFWSTNGWNWPIDDPGNFIEMIVGDDFYSMEFNQQTKLDNFHFVRAYPTGGVGSFGARWEHNGKHTAKIPVLPGIRGQGNMETQVFDMRAVAKLAGGLPCFLRDLPQIKGWFDWQFEGDGVINTFLDLYLNDVSKPHLSGDYVNTINGIGYNGTKAWNVNFWCELPTNRDHSNREKSRDRWSGGSLIARRELSNGEICNVYYKRETAGTNNNFNLLSFHSLDREKVTEIDVSALLTEVIETDWISKIKTAGLQPREDMRNPDENMVLCGLHGVGNEVWTGAGKIVYKRYGWQIGDKQVGFGHPETINPDQVVLDDDYKIKPKRKTPEKTGLFERFIDWLKSKFH